ncbi:extracellular solute-binding protein [Planctomonas psychrotolerans]|uniref:extracellular solute-binding protein n=1 Tax=Planctomonas psychrotolerans TaxID=2528712 RepID=UPI00123A705C|nr:extracellular solute-binding protein [Planctomonas psychrotolerans]
MSRRAVLGGGAALLGGAFLSTSLAGCSAVAAGDVRQLKFWHLLSGGDGIKMNALVQQANEENEQFNATQTVLTWGTPYYTKLAMASVGGRAPDVAVMHATRVAGYAPGGLLDPWDLDILAEEGVTEEDFLPRVWEQGVVDGELFAIALDTHPFIMMYNTDVAEQAGVLGEDGLLQEITSPDQFLEVARAMQAVTGEHGLSYGFLNDGAQMWRLFYTLYAQHGVEIVLEEGQPVEIDMDAAVESLEFIQSLLDGTIATPTGDYGTAVSEFVTGGSGLFFTGVWELPTMQNAELPFNASVIPTLFGTPATYADSHSFVLPHQNVPDEDKRRDVYTFVASILKNSISWAEAGHIPSYQPIVESPAYAELDPQVNYAQAAEQVVFDPGAWFSGSGSDFQAYFAENVQSVFLGREDARSGMEGFVRRLEIMLNRPNPLEAA